MRRSWGNLKPGDTLIERPILGDRVFLIVARDGGRYRFVNLITGYNGWSSCQAPTDVELREIYHVLPAAGG